MRRLFLLALLLLLLAMWLVTRGRSGDVEALAGPRPAAESDGAADAGDLGFDARGDPADAERLAATEEPVTTPVESPTPATLRVRLSQRTGWRRVTPPLGRVLVWASARGRRGLEVTATGVDPDGWTEVLVPRPDGADRIHAVWDEPGWTSSVVTRRLDSTGRVFLHLLPEQGAGLRGELVDAQGRPEEGGEVLLARRGDDALGRGDRSHVTHGDFRLMFRSRGTYELLARGRAGQARRILELDPEHPTPPLTVVLEGGGRLTGRVLDQRGLAVPEWPLVAAAEDAALDRLRQVTDLPRIEEGNYSQPGRVWASTVTGSDGSFEFRGLRAGVFSVVAGVRAPVAPACVLVERLVPPVDGLELRVPVAWTEIGVVDELGRSLRFDPHERPGTPLREDVETDVYVVVEQDPGKRVPSDAWRASRGADGTRWSVLLEAGVEARACVWSQDRRLAVTELAVDAPPPEAWTVNAGPSAETAWLRVWPTGLPDDEREELGFTIVDVERGVRVDGDVFRDVESVEVGVPPGRYEVRIHPARSRTWVSGPLPLPWSGEVALAPGEERTLEASPVRRGRLEVTWHFVVEGAAAAGGATRRDFVQRAQTPLEARLVPGPNVTGGAPRSVSLESRRPIDLAPGTWTLQVSSAAGHEAHAVVEIEAGKVTHHDLEVSLPR